MRPRYCRSADARMRMQNALLLCKPIVNLNNESEEFLQTGAEF